MIAALALALLAGPLAEPEVRTLVDRWLAAQNGGDLAAYDALYAEKFQGVRRSGARTARLDRKRWMADRARMFKRPMKVAASELAVSLVGGAARVRFVQRWSSASYEDVGTKELFVVRQGEAARIAREEMLASKVARTAGADPLPLFLVEEVGDRLVVRLEAADDAWLRGKPRLIEGAVGFRAARADVDAGKLPEPLRAWQGKTVRVYARGGQRCESKVKRLGAYARVIPHFGTEQSWRGENGDKALSPAAIASEVWTLGESGRFLGAELELAAASCKRAELADDGARPAMVVRDFALVQASDALRGRALAAFRALPAYREIAKTWRAEATDEDAKRKTWDGDDVQIQAALDPGGEGMVVVSATVGSGCGSFTAQLSALFRVRAGKLELVGLEPDHCLSPAFWLDVPGARGVLFDSDDPRNERGLWDGKARRVISDVAFLDCPC